MNERIRRWTQNRDALGEGYQRYLNKREEKIGELREKTIDLINKVKMILKG